MEKYIVEHKDNNEGLSDILRLVADLLDSLVGTNNFRLPGVLDELKSDVAKVFERFEKALEDQEELDSEASPGDNSIHGET